MMANQLVVLPNIAIVGCGLPIVTTLCYNTYNLWVLVNASIHLWQVILQHISVESFVGNATWVPSSCVYDDYTVLMVFLAYMTVIQGMYIGLPK